LIYDASLRDRRTLGCGFVKPIERGCFARGAAARYRITQRDLEDAIEKVVAGPERKSRRLGEEEKRRVAYHEVGHALMAAYSLHADPVHKISIVPRGRGALGYTMQLPSEDQFLMTRSELLDRIRGLLVDAPQRKSFLPRSALGLKMIWNVLPRSVVRWLRYLG